MIDVLKISLERHDDEKGGGKPKREYSSHSFEILIELEFAIHLIIMDFTLSVKFQLGKYIF